MPYIALQLVGIQAVLEVAGVGGSDNIIAKDAPLLVAFAVLAAYTYSSGLRAPAVIAFVKDILIYVVIIVAVVYLPQQVGGWDAIFGAAEEKMTTTNEVTQAPQGSFIPGSEAMWAYATLALGSALALFMYPHSITASLSSGTRNTVRRNAALLPAYSFVLGLLALLGWVAIAAGTDPTGLDGELNPQLVVPQLFEDFFPGWFAGVAFAAIAIGALVPAAIMSIAAANTFSRNIYKEWLKQDATPEQEAKVSKLMSLVVKAFALVFVLTLDRQNAINFQLLGGIWILQTFPAIVFSLYTRWFHRTGLLVGWAAGMVYGTVEAYQAINPITGKHFGSPLGVIPGIGDLGYIAMTAFALNLVVTVVLTLALRAMKVPNGRDATEPGDYYADADDPRVQVDLAHSDDAWRSEPKTDAG
jgi:SSS family solute:Na+ symporter